MTETDPKPLPAEDVIEPTAEPEVAAIDPGRAHWLFWELGLLAALAGLIATPAENEFQAIFGVVCLLFILGLANQGRS